MKNYNENYVIDVKVMTNDPMLHELERFCQIQLEVTQEQMTSCKCDHCLDTGVSDFLYANDDGEIRMLYALCTCDAIKNIVH